MIISGHQAIPQHGSFYHCSSGYSFYNICGGFGRHSLVSVCFRSFLPNSGPSQIPPSQAQAAHLERTLPLANPARWRELWDIRNTTRQPVNGGPGMPDEG